MWGMAMLAIANAHHVDRGIGHCRGTPLDGRGRFRNTGGAATIEEEAKARWIESAVE